MLSMISRETWGKCVAEIWQGDSVARKEAMGKWRGEHVGTQQPLLPSTSPNQIYIEVYSMHGTVVFQKEPRM